MYRQHFGLTDHPLGKKTQALWDDGPLAQIEERFQWLLHSPGLGLLSGEPGVGKTAIVRQIIHQLNPHQYQVIYTPETDFGRQDLYRNLALELGLEPLYRRAALWRALKERIVELFEHRQCLPIWIIDEAQNLPYNFFRDLPAFLNFAFDSRDMMSVWLIGHPALARTLERVPYEALASRIQIRLHIEPIIERERFRQLITHGLKQVGCHQTLLSDSGLELLRQASRGRPRQAGLLLRAIMQRAVPKGLTHLPDELIQQTIEES
jgi:MSHA biogenesis protein MshM